jgi:thiamine-monophosphate kinase
MEQSFLAWLRGRTAVLPQVSVGIGDDCAILDWPIAERGAQSLVVSTDQICDGIDFLSGQHSLADIGRKAVLVNLSDLAAMAARPVAIFVTLSLPREEATQVAAGVYEGILDIAQQYGLAIPGGDITVYDGPLAISITILGSVPAERRWLRSGAQEGDAIIVSGAFGGSILGRHLRPQPRVNFALELAARFPIHAAIDVSDGLSLDLDRLCAASGVGAEFSLESIPVHGDAVALSEQDGVAAVDHAWGDGEDFELILAVGAGQVENVLAENWGVPLTRIGTFTGRTGLWWRKANGQMERMSPRGFIHGRR